MKKYKTESKLKASRASWRVKANHVIVLRMKTKWDRCPPESGYIRINTNLTKKLQEYLEHIVVIRWYTCWSRRTTRGIDVDGFVLGALAAAKEAAQQPTGRA